MKNKYLSLIIGTIVVILASLFVVRTFAFTSNQCNANNPKNCPTPLPICQNGIHVGNPHCVRPTTIPIPTPTKKPCGCPRITPSPTPTKTPSVTPTPTETLSITPTPPITKNDEQPTSSGSSTNPPVCSDGNTVKLPANPHVIRAGEAATVNFFITEGDSANIYWKVVGTKDWQNAVADVKPNSENFVSFTIHSLNPNLGYDFGIQQKTNCGGGSITGVVIDGPASETFRVSYWVF